MNPKSLAGLAEDDATLVDCPAQHSTAQHFTRQHQHHSMALKKEGELTATLPVYNVGECVCVCPWRC